MGHGSSIDMQTFVGYIALVIENHWKQWSDCCLELQKIMTLELGFCSRKLVTMANPFETKMAFFAQISNFISISR
jgi:hypothetical protein